MANDRIAVPYNHKLTRLESLLAGVERAGDFFVHGSLDAPIPRVEIDGVGVLSFPVPASQLEAVIRRARRAPYGRGEQTIVDTSVRNAWQLDSADVRISGFHGEIRLTESPRRGPSDPWLTSAWVAASLTAASMSASSSLPRGTSGCNCAAD